jgi:hypothetical protein
MRFAMIFMTLISPLEHFNNVTRKSSSHRLLLRPLSSGFPENEARPSARSVKNFNTLHGIYFLPENFSQKDRIS